MRAGKDPAYRAVAGWAGPSAGALLRGWHGFGGRRRGAVAAVTVKRRSDGWRAVIGINVLKLVPCVLRRAQIVVAHGSVEALEDREEFWEGHGGASAKQAGGCSAIHSPVARTSAALRWQRVRLCARLG